MTAVTPRLRPFALLLLLALLLAAPPLAQAQSTVTIDEARDATSEVTFEGIVTRAFGSYARIQDASGATGASAIVIRQTADASSTDFRDAIADGTIQPGTRLRVTGTPSEFQGVVQINDDVSSDGTVTDNLASFEVLSQGDPPAAQSVTLNDLVQNGEDYESELVRIEGLRFPGASGTFENAASYDVSDGSATLTFRVQREDESALGGTAIPEGPFTYTGVTGQFFDSYQLIPVRPGDLEPTVAAFFAGRNYALAYEAGGSAEATITVRVEGLAAGESATVTVAASDAGDADASVDLTGFGGSQTLTFSGSDPAPQTLTLTAASDGATEGIERLELALSTDDAGVAASGRFTLWILDDETSQSTLFADLEGEALRQQLRETFASDADGTPGPPTLGYNRARDTLYAVVYNDGGVVRGFYSGYEATLDGGDPSEDVGDEDINTEHTWPQSMGAEEEPATSNMHNLVPAYAPVNSARSNYPYGEIPDADTDTWFFEAQTRSSPPTSNIDAWSEVDETPSDFQDRRFEPREMVRGDVARKSFYFLMAYPDRANLAFYERQKEDLRQWHDQDPVGAQEQRRNVLIASNQGDALNPFALDPTLVERAFFTGDAPGGDVIPIADARALDLGRTATVEGIVTRIDNDSDPDDGVTYVQDETGAIAIFDEAVAGDVNPGDRLRVTGTTDVFAGALQLSEVSNYIVVSSGNALPDAQTLTLAEVLAGAEGYESELVRVEGFTFDMAGGTFEGGTNYPVSDGSGGGSDVELRIPGSSSYVGQPIPSGEMTFTGVLGQFNGDFGSVTPNKGYQLLALADGDLSGGDVGETLTVDFSRSFGDPDAQTGYRLVALPGNVDRPLAGTIDGANGSAWQAYWDDGSDSDYFVQWNDSETFNFRPGRGFWLIAEGDWTVNTSVPAVTLGSDDTYAIDLHEGWNIISNPLAASVDWSAVEAENGGTLQPLWAFEGSYTQSASFASATGGEAFYFLNNTGLTELIIPTPAPPAAVTQRSKTQREGEERTLILTTYRGGKRTSIARVGTVPGAADGLDVHDAFAPPGRFAAASLRLPVPGNAASTDERRQWLAGERRAPDQPGYTFDLVLRTEPGEAPVTLRAGGLGDFEGQAVHLVEPATGRTHDLRSKREVQITPAQNDETPLRLLVGRAAETKNIPDEVTLSPGYPNPSRGEVTLEYALPEATNVRVAIYDLLGRRVRTLVDARREAGPHTLRWDGSAASGAPVASGVYFVRLTAGDATRSEKLVRVK